MSIQFFEIIQLIQWGVIVICLAAVLYATIAVLTPMSIGRWRHSQRFGAYPASGLSGVSVLKPLCGTEPRLYENLATFCVQTHHAYQLICGVSSSDDPAIAVVRQLQRHFPDSDIALVVEARQHGTNRKVSNLINMAECIRYPWIVLADRDIAVDRHYLQKVTTPLTDPSVGVVTCLYRGVSVSGVWSRIGALFINQWFAPSVSMAHAGGSTRFGFGATLALRATTLASIGGFMRLKNCLADDYWLAEHARQLGLRTVLSSEMVATDVIETNLTALWTRELRWLRTIRSLNPLGFGFLFITFTSPWLMIAGALSYLFYLDASTAMDVAVEATILVSIDMTWLLACITGSGCLARLLIHGRSAYHVGGFWRDLALVPIRDSILLLQWMAACFGSRVAWRGASIPIDNTQPSSTARGPLTSRSVITTADDFGLDERVNLAVEQGHQHGILAAASLMVGAPAVQDAIRRAVALPTLRVGLHIVLVDGRSILPHAVIPLLVDHDRRFSDGMVRNGFRFCFLPEVQRQLVLEITAQFEAFAETGLTLDHVNTHKHFHVHPTVLSLILRIGARFGMRAVRLPYERQAPMWLRPWMHLMRCRLRNAGIGYNDYLIGMRHTGRMTEQQWLRALSNLPAGVTEIYCHPAVGDDGPITRAMQHYQPQAEYDALRSRKVAQAVKASGARIGGFTDCIANGRTDGIADDVSDRTADRTVNCIADDIADRTGDRTADDIAERYGASEQR